MQLDGVNRQKGETARSIAAALRHDILRGRFAAGEILPGSRTLARELRVSRGTINVVIAMLAAEGLVAATTAGLRILFKPAQQRRPEPINARAVRLSYWARRLPAAPAKSETPPFFATGRIASGLFPEQQWLRALRAGRRELLSANRLYAHVDPAGVPGLREAIAAHLRSSRRIDADARNIVITTGSMQAIALVAQLLLNSRDRAAFENPGYRGIREAIRSTGATALACSVDDAGMQLPEKKCSLAFVTPASQFPLGVTMSVERRGEFVAWCRSNQCMNVEDEYDSEFYRLLHAPPALASSAGSDQIIYLGSFSRTLFPGLRLGYALLPDNLTAAFLKARRLYDPMSPAAGDQLTLQHFMQNGAYRLHLRRMNRVYRERHDTLLTGINEYLGNFFDPLPSAAGLSVCARWKKPPKVFRAAQEAATRTGFGWQDCTPYFSGKGKTMAVFGFAHLEPELILTGLRHLARHLQRLK